MTPPEARTKGSYRRLAAGLRRAGVVMLFAVLAAAAAVSPLHSLERSWGLDSLYALRGPRDVPAGVTVIALHGAAARALEVSARPDRWPRTLHAELLERLHAQGARVVAFDLLFDRPREAEGDERLRQALHQAGNGVLVAYLRRDLQAGGQQTMAAVDQLVTPLPALAEAALATAPFALVKSPEGVLSYLAFVPEGDDHPSLPLVLAARMRPEALAPLASAAALPGDQAPHVLLSALRRAALAEPARWRPPAVLQEEPRPTRRWRQLLTEPGDEVFLNVYGPPGQVPTLPYDQALAALREGGAAAERFRGAAVLVGAAETNQPEQRDVYRTPWSTRDGLDISGVELAATALANQLDGSTLRTWPLAWQAALTAALGMLLLAPWRLWPMRWALPLSMGLASGYAVLASLAFAHSLWLPWAVPLLVVWPVSLVLGLGLRLRDVERQRQRLRQALSRYAPREEIARLARELRHADDTVFVACLSTDIEDYTRRIESRDPGEARRWLNAYFETAFPIVRAHGGHVVDHAGDSMICIWLSGKDPRSACTAAVTASRALSQALNRSRAGEFDPQAFPTRLGLHFGPVSLGEVGDAQYAEQRVVGDIVNTASRIQSSNKPLGTRVLVSDVIAQHLAPGSFRPLGRFLLTGKRQDVGLADPLVGDGDLQQQHAQALSAWEQGELSRARELLETLLRRWPDDGPARFLLKCVLQPPAADPAVARHVITLHLK